MSEFLAVVAALLVFNRDEKSGKIRRGAKLRVVNARSPAVLSFRSNEPRRSWSREVLCHKYF